MEGNELVPANKIKLKDFWNRGVSVIVRIPDAMPKDLIDNNMCKFDIYNEYADTLHFWEMRKDQYEKMKNHAKDKYFLLSWTLTHLVANIRDCARGANGHLAND